MHKLSTWAMLASSLAITVLILARRTVITTSSSIVWIVLPLKEIYIYMNIEVSRI